jgi:hypothetical protein
MHFIIDSDGATKRKIAQEARKMDKGNKIILCHGRTLDGNSWKPDGWKDVGHETPTPMP